MIVKVFDDKTALGTDRNAGRVQGPTGFKRWAKNPHLAP
jgi:hypothetical protein